MICVECGGLMHESSDSISETFRGEEFTIEGIHHYACDSCGEIVFDAEDGKKFDAAILEQYAAREGLLSSEEIKALRTKYGLNQQDFAKVLGVSLPSVARWETGRVLQPKSTDLLMRAYAKEPLLMNERIKQAGVHASAGQTRIISFPGNRSGRENPFAFDAADQTKEG